MPVSMKNLDVPRAQRMLDRDMHRPTLHAIVCALSFMSLIPDARADAAGWGGSSDAYTMGQTAALTGGAGLAIMKDLGAAWYNPAGLALSERKRMDISGNVFMLRLRNVAQLFTLTAPKASTQTDLASTELLSVPSALVYGWQLSDRVNIAFFVFQPQSDTLSLSANLDATVPYPERAGYEARLNNVIRLAQTSSVYHIGPAIGWEVTPRLRLGLGLSVIYDTGVQHLTYRSVGTARDGRDTVLETSHLGTEWIDSWTSIGLQATLGFQWEPIKNLLLGVRLRSPPIQVGAWYTSHTIEGYVAGDRGGSVDSDFSVEDATEKKEEAQVVGPMRIDIGVAYRWSRGWIALDVSLSPEFNAPDLGLKRNLVWNMKLGALLRLKKTLKIGFGLFTDRSDRPSPTTDDSILTARVDYYGLCLGGTFKTEYRLKAGRPSLVMETTLGLRYAIGFGRVAGLAWRPLDSEIPTGTLRDVVFHEVSFHLGSSFHF